MNLPCESPPSHFTGTGAAPDKNHLVSRQVGESPMAYFILYPFVNAFVPSLSIYTPTTTTLLVTWDPTSSSSASNPNGAEYLLVTKYFSLRSSSNCYCLGRMNGWIASKEVPSSSRPSPTSTATSSFRAQVAEHNAQWEAWREKKKKIIFPFLLPLPTNQISITSFPLPKSLFSCL